MATKLKKPIHKKPANKNLFDALIKKASKPLPLKKKTKAYYWVYIGWKHKVVNHSKGQFRNGAGVHTNSIEGFWSHLKRGINGTYHWVSHKHIQRYCNEFGYKFDTRHLQNNERFIDFLSNISNTKVKYKDLIF